MAGRVRDDSLLDADDDRGSNGESLGTCHGHETDCTGRASGPDVLSDRLYLA